jgi:hypothetical protein
VAKRFPERAVQKSLTVALALSETYDRLLTALALELVKTAKAPEAQTCSRLRSMPGGGKILALVLRDASHEIHRFPRVQDVASSCRLVTWAKEAAGKRSGTGGTTIGQADLQWAFSAAAVLLLRHHPLGQTSLAKRARKHGKAQALSILAQQPGRAVSFLLKRHEAVEMHTFLATCVAGGDGEARRLTGAIWAKHGSQGLCTSRDRAPPRAPQAICACLAAKGVCWDSRPAPINSTRVGESGSRGRPLPRAWRSLREADPLQPDRLSRPARGTR